FAAGDATTAFIGQHQDALLQPDATLRQRAAALAALLLYETSPERQPGAPAASLAPTLPIGLRYRVNGAEHQASLAFCGGNRFEVTMGESRFAFETIALTGH